MTFDRNSDNVILAGAGRLAGAQATLLDLQGRVLSAFTVVRDRAMLSTAWLPEGIYVVRVSGVAGSRSFRVPVTR